MAEPVNKCLNKTMVPILFWFDSGMVHRNLLRCYFTIIYIPTIHTFQVIHSHPSSPPCLLQGLKIPIRIHTGDMNSSWAYHMYVLTTAAVNASIFDVAHVTHTYLIIKEHLHIRLLSQGWATDPTTDLNLKGSALPVLVSPWNFSMSKVKKV